LTTHSPFQTPGINLDEDALYQTGAHQQTRRVRRFHSECCRGAFQKSRGVRSNNSKAVPVEPSPMKLNIGGRRAMAFDAFIGLDATEPWRSQLRHTSSVRYANMTAVNARFLSGRQNSAARQSCRRIHLNPHEIQVLSGDYYRSASPVPQANRGLARELALNWRSSHLHCPPPH
jgi:hypothetical protein